jgi:hypothetical protein
MLSNARKGKAVTDTGNQRLHQESRGCTPSDWRLFPSDGPLGKELTRTAIRLDGRPSFVRMADYPPSESDTANTFLIESGNPLTGCLPDVWYQPVTHLLEIFPVALQIACQQLLLDQDAHHE